LGHFAPASDAPTFAQGIGRVSLFLRAFDAIPEVVASFRHLFSLGVEIACFGRAAPVVGARGSASPLRRGM
jgi:hypothetical protein